MIRLIHICVCFCAWMHGIVSARDINQPLSCVCVCVFRIASTAMTTVTVYYYNNYNEIIIFNRNRCCKLVAVFVCSASSSFAPLSLCHRVLVVMQRILCYICLHRDNMTTHQRLIQQNHNTTSFRLASIVNDSKHTPDTSIYIIYDMLSDTIEDVGNAR